jgi:integrase
LQYGDLDLDSGTVRVRRTLVRDARTSRHSYSEPKTRAGRRTVELTAQALDALRTHLQRLKATPHPAKLVFADRRGRPLRRSNFLRRVWSPLLTKAKLPDVPFHALRHTAATLAIASGADVKVVQQMLGHSSAALTLDTYADYLPQRGREVPDRMGALLGGETRAD